MDEGHSAMIELYLSSGTLEPIVPTANAVNVIDLDLCF